MTNKNKRKGKSRLQPTKIFFLNDDDGFSSRDFLLIAVIGMYFMLFAFCLWSLVYRQSIPTDAFTLFESTDSIIITVVGGTMGVVGIEKIMSRKKSRDVATTPKEATEVKEDNGDGI